MRQMTYEIYVLSSQSVNKILQKLINLQSSVWVMLTRTYPDSKPKTKKTLKHKHRSKLLVYT